MGGSEPSTNPDKRCTYALFSDHLPGKIESSNLPPKSSGEYGRDGKWVKGKCDQKFKFVCRMDQSNFVRECDENWTLIGEKFCVKVGENLLTWSESLSACGETGGVNLELENDQIEGLMRSFLNEKQSSEGQGSA